MKILPKHQRRGSSRSKGGWAMVVTIFVILVAASTASVLLTSSLTGNTNSRVNKNSTSARYRAEGGLAAGQQALLTAVANYRPVPDGGSVEIVGEPVEYTVTATGVTNTETDPSGIQSVHDGYRIDARAGVFGANETAHQFMDVVTVPIFQFAVFYTGDLEINPGPSMTLSGRVHTNGDLYLNCGNTLTLDTNYVRAVGNLYRHRKDDPSRSTGTVDVRHWVENPFDPSEPSLFSPLNSQSQMSGMGVGSISGYDSNFVNGYDADGDGLFTGPNDWLPWALGAIEYWNQPDGYVSQGSTIQTADHGLSAAMVPSINSISMYEPVDSGDYVQGANGVYEPAPGGPGTGTHDMGYFHEQAGLSILTYPDGTWQAFDGAGNEVTSSLDGTDPTLPWTDPVVTIETIYDARQGGDVQVTRVDMARLNGSGVFPPNGLLYASSYETGAGTSLKGVELFNGSELASPLSVVTDGAAYVQGDYNVTNKKGASVIADAVNLLSNAWDGSKSPGQLPSASQTTFNLAFITGNHETHVGSYNGGFENLPRFHENWSGVNCNVRGSFVNAWESQYATGNWRYGGDVYKAPRRNWSYDTLFNDVANLPPYTPSVVLGESVALW